MLKNRLTIKELHKFTEGLIERGYGSFPVALSINLGCAPADGTLMTFEHDGPDSCLMIRDNALARKPRR